MDERNIDLRDAVPPTPDLCRNAVLHAVSTYTEEQKMRRPYKVILVVAVVVALLCGTVALAASGWNVLRFLQLSDNHMSNELVENVSAQAAVDHCSIQIDSVVTDGRFLAFDWTVQNSDVSQPVYIQVDSFTGNGVPLFTDGTDDFNYQWFPGMFNEGIMQDGNLAMLPDEIIGDKLDVEMVVGVYTPKQPVYQMEVFDVDDIRQKQNEGYYVLVAGEGLVFEDPREGLVIGYGPMNDMCADSFDRTEMVARFTVDLSEGRETLKQLPLPEPFDNNGFKMQYTYAAVSSLQVSCTIEMYPDNMSREEANALLSEGYFELTDMDGNMLDAVVLNGFGGIRERDDGSWCVYFDYSFANDVILPNVVSVSFFMDDGGVLLAPIEMR